MNKEGLKIFSEHLKSPEYYLKGLLWLRDEHFDDLPGEDVRVLYPHGHPKCDRFKCQGNYIAGLKSELEAMVFFGIIKDEELRKKIEDFRKYEFSWKRGEFTTQEEIDLINKILNEVIEYLSGLSEK